MSRVNVYASDRYVIAASVNGISYKLFQITFAKSDSSLFIIFPYLKGCGGRLGVVTIPKGSNYFKIFNVGKDFPVTSHLVKYSHHPSGQAHFSLSGKVLTDVRKKSVPLSLANGHIFTAIFQGLSHFEIVKENEKATEKRGIVPFHFIGKNIQSIKFVCHFYSEKELRIRVKHFDETPWTKVMLPNGKFSVGIPLSTPFYFEGERRYLFLGAEYLGYPFATNIDRSITFMGGFDPENVVFDYTHDSSFLMMFIHDLDNINKLAKMFGTIDL